MKKLIKIAIFIIAVLATSTSLAYASGFFYYDSTSQKFVAADRTFNIGGTSGAEFWFNSANGATGEYLRFSGTSNNGAKFHVGSNSTSSVPYGNAIVTVSALEVRNNDFVNLFSISGAGVISTKQSLELSSLDNVNRNTYIDFHSDTDNADDYDMRLIRYGGANADGELRQRGTGNLNIRHEETGDINLTANGGNINFGTSGNGGIMFYSPVRSGLIIDNNLLYLKGGTTAGSEGGQMQIAKGPSTAAGDWKKNDWVIDEAGGFLRIFTCNDASPPTDCSHSLTINAATGVISGNGSGLTGVAGGNLADGSIGTTKLVNGGTYPINITGGAGAATYATYLNNQPGSYYEAAGTHGAQLYPTVDLNLTSCTITTNLLTVAHVYCKDTLASGWVGGTLAACNTSGGKAFLDILCVK